MAGQKVESTCSVQPDMASQRYDCADGDDKGSPGRYSAHEVRLATTMVSPPCFRGGWVDSHPAAQG